MKIELSDLTDRYTSALEDFLAGGGEAALQHAYEVGRRALADGLGVLDMVTLYHEALVKLLPSMSTPEERANTAKALQRFFVESLTPFEMTHRGFREANAALRKSEERYRELFENANDVVFTLDLEGNITSINRAGERLSGHSRSEAPAMNIAQVFSPEYLGLVRQMLERKMAGEEFTTYELELIAKNSHRVPLEISTRLIFQDGMPIGVQGIARDVTERKRAEEALLGLNEMLEEEAKRIAHALHDEAGQLLASAHISLAAVARDLPISVRERLQLVRDNLDQIEAQLRRLSHELRPTILDDLGLLPALEFLAQGVSARTGIPVRVEGSTEGRLPSNIETTLYRTVQEALNNVTKHAQAKHVIVKLERREKAIQCSVGDDGIGFDVAGVLGERGRGGIGLIGIQERLNALGGTRMITSHPGQGTQLSATVPLENK